MGDPTQGELASRDDLLLSYDRLSREELVSKLDHAERKYQAAMSVLHMVADHLGGHLTTRAFRKALRKL